MSHQYQANIVWERGDQPFLDNKYSRAHHWNFDNGASILASSAPNAVPPPLSREDAVDPEEGLVAALSSCHMLFFLAFCAIKGFRVDRYDDHPLGVMTKNEKGKLYISHVVLKPAVTWSGDKKPNAEEIARMHERAHEECYIGHSLRAEVEIVVTEPVYKD